MYISRDLWQMVRSQSIVQDPLYISWALCRVGRSQSILLGSYVYIPGLMSDGKIPD